jgi:hypothetical protein
VRWLTSKIPATWEVEIERIIVQGQAKKIWETQSQQKMLGVLVHTCHPSYMDGIGRDTAFQGLPRQNCKTLFEK